MKDCQLDLNISLLTRNVLEDALKRRLLRRFGLHGIDLNRKDPVIPYVPLAEAIEDVQSIYDEREVPPDEMTAAVEALRAEHLIFCEPVAQGGRCCITVPGKAVLDEVDRLIAAAEVLHGEREELSFTDEVDQLFTDLNDMSGGRAE